MMNDNISRYQWDCFAFTLRDGQMGCKALKDFYSSYVHNRCKGCPFYRNGKKFKVDKKFEEAEENDI